MAVNTWDDFIGVLEKSKLLNASRLAEARRLTAGLVEPTAIARKLVQQNLISRWQAGQLVAGRHTFFISKYRLIDLLGTEPLGPVFLAEHTQMDRRVVLKTLARREGNSASSVERFLHEAQSLATLDHRNLSHVYDVDREGDFYYLVMEYVQGRNLQQAVDSDGPLPVDAAAGFIALAADALSHAHLRGILHLGIRPDRLVIDTQGTLKVLDIGVARLAASGETAAAEANPTAGDRLLYLAPEQFQAASGTQTFDARTDIFSLGCVFYFLLTGKSPFTGGNEAERKKSRGTPPAEIRTRRKDVPQELIDICKKMMGRSPQERYATSADVAAALETWLKQTEGSRMAAQARAAAARPRQEPARSTSQSMDQETEADQIDTNRARPSDNAPAADGTEQAAEPTGRRKKTSLASNAPWILAAVGGLVMVLAGIGLTITVMRSGPVEPPATVAAGTTTGAAAVAANTAPAGANALDSGEFVFYPLPVDHVEPLPGVTFTPRKDGSILVGGVPPATATYRIAARLDVSDLLGLRLDVLPSREPGNRKHPGPLIPFRLSEVTAEIATDEKFTHPIALKFARATPDYEEPGFTAAQGIDGDVKTHWAVDKAGKSPHALILWTDKPFGNPTGKAGPYWLRVTLDQQAGGAQTLRLFKLSLVLPSRGEAPGPDKPPVGPETPAAKPAPQVLAYWRFDPADAKPAAKPEGKSDGKSDDKSNDKSAPEKQPEKSPEKPPKEKQLTGKNRPAVEDMSGSGNHLYADGADDAPHWSKETPGDIVRATKAPNVRSLDLTEPAAKPNSGHGLRTDSVRSQPAHEMATAKLDAVTVEASFKLSELGHSHALVGQDGPAKAAGGLAPLQLRVGGDDDKVQFEVADNKGKTHLIRSSEPVVANRWYHVAAGSDGHRLRMWLDTGDGKGLQPQGEVALPAPMAKGKEAWRVGRGYFNGQPADDAAALIDEVRVTAGPLEPADMLMFGTPEQLAADKEKADKLATTKATATPESAADDKQKFNALEIDKIEAVNLKDEKLADVEFKPQPDGSYLVEGESPPAAIYVLRVHTKLTQITGFRLEAFADQRLPNNGPGRSEVKPGGQFVVTQFAVLTSSRASEVRPKPTEWAKADADFSQADRLVANLASSAASAGWAIMPQVGKSHWAMLTAKQPLGYAGGTWLTIRIAQSFGQKHTLGRFRVMAVTGKAPGEEPGAAIAAADQILNPLSKLPKVVAFPDLPADGNAQAAAEATKPIDLGEIFRPPGVPLKVKLRGGETADDDGNTFHLVEPADGAETQRWPIEMQASGEAQGERVAEFALIGDQLKFRWTDAAVKHLNANCLRNCVLHVGVGEQQRNIALREPASFEGLDLGFAKASGKTRAELPWPPRTALIKLSLVVDDKAYPPHKIKETTFDAVKGTTDIVFQEKEQLPLIASIQSTLRRANAMTPWTLTLSSEALFLTAPDARPQQYSMSRLERFMKQLKAEHTSVSVIVARLTNPPKGVTLTERNKQQLELGKQRLVALDNMGKLLVDLPPRAEAITKVGLVPVQVYYMVGNTKVVLMQQAEAK